MRKKVEYAQFTIRIKEDLCKKVEKVAKGDDRSRNYMIEKLLELGLKHYKP